MRLRLRRREPATLSLGNRTEGEKWERGERKRAVGTPQACPGSRFIQRGINDWVTVPIGSPGAAVRPQRSHHRTYGSGYGGSCGTCKATMLAEKTDETQLRQLMVGQRHVDGAAAL